MMLKLCSDLTKGRKKSNRNPNSHRKRAINPVDSMRDDGSR